MVKTGVLWALVVTACVIGLVAVATGQSSALQTTEEKLKRAADVVDTGSGAPPTLTATAQPAAEPVPAASGQAAARNVYFGEQHMHTQNSFDGFTVAPNQTWEQAYRYGMGEPITLETTGETIQRRTPYDFVAITDHSEYYGVLKYLVDPNSPLSQSEFARGFTAGMQDPAGGGARYVTQLIGTLLANNPMQEYITPDLLSSNWQDFIDVADRFNRPGEFTTLYAFEWTSIPNGQNMHRNVFFRETAPVVPFSSFDSQDPEDLWTYLEVQRNQGIETFAIPHNSNVSDGWMFSPNKFHGGPIDERYARRRQLNEPLFEIAQTKGQSDAHPVLSPNDEFAEFEMFTNMINVGVPSAVKYGFWRQALADGLKFEQELGYNPFKHGIVAGADFHSGYQGNEEWGFNGAHGIVDDTPQKRLDPRPQPTGEPNAIVSSAATTAVWADENTRAGIFDAMARRETYGTSGTLIQLRMFGGWNFTQSDLDGDDWVTAGYGDGVPMGGDLPAMAAGASAPTIMVKALKDPESGNLDRIQIIKVWSDARTLQPKEQIYEVALADGRMVAADGTVPPVGNSVDVTTATYTNDIGDTELSAVWTDPDFDATIPTAYYVRVLEIPTPRWSTYDSARNNLPLSTLVPATIQERAWSSPIWYMPGQ